MYVCICKGITDSQIRTTVEDGASSMREVCNTLGIASQCGKCGQHAKQIIQETMHAASSSDSQFYAL
jgi:bacterioferritin-associated ferredoxin